jgi:hypothetical protein
LVQRVVMFEKRKLSRDAETDRCIQLADGLLIVAEKELSAFVSVVHKLFGSEQARRSALHWIEELELMDWPSGESTPDWRRATVVASARLGALLSRSGEPELGKRGRRFLRTPAVCDALHSRRSLGKECS